MAASNYNMTADEIVTFIGQNYPCITVRAQVAVVPTGSATVEIPMGYAVTRAKFYQMGVDDPGQHYPVSIDAVRNTIVIG